MFLLASAGLLFTDFHFHFIFRFDVFLLSSFWESYGMG